MYFNKLVIFLMVLLIIVTLFIGYFFGKNNLGLNFFKNDAQIKNIKTNSVELVNNIDSMSIYRLLNFSGSDLGRPIDINQIDKLKKTKLKNFINNIPIDKRLDYIRFFPKMHFYGNNGRFYFYDSSIDFQIGKINQNNDKVKFFNACSLPGIQGKIISNNNYNKDQLDILNKFYASDWQFLNGNKHNFTKIILLFEKNGYCDITDPQCIFYNNPKKMREMIFSSMNDLKDIFRFSSSEGHVEAQIDLYLTCILPKYTKSPDKILPFLNQIGQFPALLGVGDNAIVNGFFDSLNELLAK